MNKLKDVNIIEIKKMVQEVILDQDMIIIEKVVIDLHVRIEVIEKVIVPEVVIEVREVIDHHVSQELMHLHLLKLKSLVLLFSCYLASFKVVM